MSTQNSFLAIAHKKKLRCEKFLDDMSSVIPWDSFLAQIEPHYEEKERGRSKMDMKMMLQIYFLQQWFNLSDPGVEDMIYDRASFQKFLGIDLLADRVPDETTILNFRHLLEEHQLQVRFFDIVNELLEERGLIKKDGTIVDATIINAPSSTKNQKKERDPEMSSTKKGGNYYFGMKGHIGVDAQGGLVHSLETSTASVHDKDKMGDLLHGEENALFGDKGYIGREEKIAARVAEVYWGVLDKAARNRPLSSSQKKRNNKMSKIRSKVEHPFQVIKCQWKYTKVRYKGLFKNSMQLHTLFALCNLFKARKKLMALS
ncbi:IS5/IS1182 family transposase [Candidatus Kaiserbacteria bacterium CG_4_8_14_3_um_filter_38_9]|uniref:IS5/IS1182 family transposase n=1 Tax=Candidatus Kaiserbacteria bacterium CG_4_8_14_3_um_filter_38_9 TaxID=1974599 RepID=A0A2M7INI3_9BACT|nr:MAG: IS5 family transposase [Candidatus Peregrinibacteria bacterium CG2_30_44_17]PIW96912.1 MAG: IS5/IS1182 family transposase [Candidatus Kaiserbacteria bacterium CG_4_8_14_3_um_filter_38_9]